jgi:hypothetical protein
MQNKKEDYFVRIDNPSQARRTILENARDVIKILKDYEAFKEIRQNRSDLIEKFKNDMNEINALVEQMKKTLPKSTTKITVKKQIITETPEKSNRDLRKLEQELSDIEAKLSEI